MFIQSIVHQKLQLLPILLAIHGIRPKRTALAWRPRMNWANFWYLGLKRSVLRTGHSASIETSGSQKAPSLGGVFNGLSNMWPTVVMTKNYGLIDIFWPFFARFFSSNVSIVVGTLPRWSFQPDLTAHNIWHLSNPTKYKALRRRNGHLAFGWIPMLLGA